MFILNNRYAVFGVDDPRLDEYMPPLDPGCRCWLEQTTAPASEEMPDYRPDPQWAGNPGRTGEIFNGGNSYARKVEDRTAGTGIRRQAELAKEYMPYRQIIEAGENKVYVNDFADPKDVGQNIEAAKKIARGLGKDVYIRPHRNIDGVKNPELSIGRKSVLGDLKTYDGKSRFTNFIQKGVKNANIQEAEVVVLDISTQHNISEIDSLLVVSLHNRNHNIKRIILIHGRKVAEITRKQVKARMFDSLKPIK